MNNVLKYLKKHRVSEGVYDSRKACMIASKLFITATYEKDSSIYILGECKIRFVSTTE